MIRKISITLILVTVVALTAGSTTYAQEALPRSPLESVTPEVIITPAATSSPDDIRVDDRQKKNNEVKDEVDDDSQEVLTFTEPDAPSSNTAISTTTSPTEEQPATTTPPKSAPRNGDLIDPDIEDILNQIAPIPDQEQQIEPTDEEDTEPIEPDPVIDETGDKPGTSIDIDDDNMQNVETPANDDEGALSTSTPAVGSLERTPNGGSNQFAPQNYYIPLDRLSVEATYGLSAIAALLGIAGAFLVIRDPRPILDFESEEIWQPVGASRFRPHEPLLEP